MERENRHNTVNVVQVVVFSGSHEYSQLEIFYIINNECVRWSLGLGYIMAVSLSVSQCYYPRSQKSLQVFSIEKRSMCHDRKNVA